MAARDDACDFFLARPARISHKSHATRESAAPLSSRHRNDEDDEDDLEAGELRDHDRVALKNSCPLLSPAAPNWPLIRLRRS